MKNSWINRKSVLLIIIILLAVLGAFLLIKALSVITSPAIPIWQNEAASLVVNKLPVGLNLEFSNDFGSLAESTSNQSWEKYSFVKTNDEKVLAIELQKGPCQTAPESIPILSPEIGFEASIEESIPEDTINNQFTILGKIFNYQVYKAKPGTESAEIYQDKLIVQIRSKDGTTNKYETEIEDQYFCFFAMKSNQSEEYLKSLFSTLQFSYRSDLY